MLNDRAVWTGVVFGVVAALLLGAVRARRCPRVSMRLIAASAVLLGVQALVEVIS